MDYWIDILAALRWWGVLTLLGAAAFPLGHWLFDRLPDRGYAVSKMFGLLLTSYIFWLSASLGLTGNNLGGILLGAAVVAALSLWAFRQSGGSVWSWLRQNWRYVLLTELLFVLLFALWTVVRAQNPSITATEKPMDFAFLNAAANSPAYPPLDPWLSGFTISYYYFGYIMVSVLARLAAVSEAVAFNLAIAWLVAGSGAGAFGLVYNLAVQLPKDEEEAEEKRACPLPLTQIAVFVALLAALAVPLAGNGQMLLETLHGRGAGAPSLWAWLDVRDINTAPADQPRYLDANGAPSSAWWWWRASRPIHEYHLSGRPEEGLEPIAEFPAFSFILGDMHPHVLALPFAFLSLLLAFNWYLGAGPGGAPAAASLGEEPLSAWLRRLISGQNRLRFLLAAIIVGGLSFLNTWDVLIHLFVLVGAYTLARWRENGWSADRWSEAIALGFSLVILAYLLYLPFYLGFSSQAGPPFILPMLMRPTRLSQFWIIFGRPLLVIIPFLLLALSQAGNLRRGVRPALLVGIGLPIGLLLLALLLALGLAAHASGAGLIAPLAAELGAALPERSTAAAFDWSWGAAALSALLPAYFKARLSYIGLTALLAAILTAVVLLWHAFLTKTDPPIALEKGDRDRNRLPFALLLIFTGVLLTLGPEFVYLRDNFGQRLNTIFKFYYQAWILFGVSASIGLAYLWRRQRLLGGSVGLLYTSLLLFSLFFPLQAVRSRSVEYRGPAGVERQPATLDGLAYLARANPADFEAIRWLAEHIPPGSVILEATGNPYSYYARVSANTGLPTVLGWANHEFQWRGDSTDEPGSRIAQVADIYNTRDLNEAAGLLDRFGVDYIYVGTLEKQVYDPRGLEKFATNLTLVYANESVAIYRWEAQQES